MRRAKIVCTLGPAVNTPEKIRALVDAGMDVARMNLSHGSYADHEQVYRMVREASDASGHGVGIFADLQGPKIRLGKVADGPLQLEAGATFTITTREVPGDATHLLDDVQGTARRRQRGRPDPDRRRQGAPRGRSRWGRPTSSPASASRDR